MTLHWKYLQSKSETFLSNNDATLVNLTYDQYKKYSLQYCLLLKTPFDYSRHLFVLFFYLFTAIEKLLRDLKRLMLSGDHSDTKLRVQMEEFRLHKSILSIRNPSFELMFKKELREKTAETVHITDCEPEQFRSLIHYIYTGTADKLSPENVFSLYEVAERYQEEQLKAECLQIMNNSISVDNFCDIIVLALKDNEQQLLKAAVEFFPCKAKEIIRSVKWKSFVKKYPEQACELHMKALDCDNK